MLSEVNYRNLILNIFSFLGGKMNQKLLLVEEDDTRRVTLDKRSDSIEALQGRCERSHLFHMISNLNMKMNMLIMASAI